MAAGKAPRLHFPCSSPNNFASTSICLYFPPSPHDFSLFIPFSLFLRDLLHRSTYSPSLFLTATLARLFLSLSAAVSINLPSLTLFTGCVHPARDGISGRNFVSQSMGHSPLALRFHFAKRRQGSAWTCAKKSHTISCLARINC